MNDVSHLTDHALWQSKNKDQIKSFKLKTTFSPNYSIHVARTTHQLRSCNAESCAQLP
jgi:hypothetical protein